MELGGVGGAGGDDDGPYKPTVRTQRGARDGVGAAWARRGRGVGAAWARRSAVWAQRKRGVCAA